MNSPSERLKQARVEQGLASAAEAARRFGWTTSTYAGHENGSRGMKMDAAEKYARAFHVSPEWLMFGGGRSLEARTKPVSSQRGFAEPEVEPIGQASALKLRSIAAKAAADDGTETTTFVVKKSTPALFIRKGDLIIINLRLPAKDGDIVVANQVDLITSAATTLIRQLAGTMLVVGAEAEPIPLSDNLVVMGRVDLIIREANTKRT